MLWWAVLGGALGWLLPPFVVRFCQSPQLWPERSGHFLHRSSAALASALAWALVAGARGTDGASVVYYGLWASVLVAVAFTDLFSRRIPNRLTVLGAVLVLAHILLFARTSALGRIEGAIVLGGAMAVLGWLSRGGMGGGDVKLVALIGFGLGLQSGFLALILGLLAGGIGAVLLLVSGRVKLRGTLAFGPYLSLGALMALWLWPHLGGVLLRG